MADQTTTTLMDPAVRQAWQSNLGYAQQVANQLGPQGYAGFDPLYQQGESQMLAAGQGLGTSNLNTAADLTRAAGAYAPMAMGPDQSMIQGYFNPYQSQVVNNTMQQLEQQRQQAMNTTNQQALQAKAFGGSRQGVAQALSNQAWGQTAANTMANLNMQGWQQAQNLAQQAAMANQSAGLQGAQMRLGAASQLGNIGQQQTAQQVADAQRMMQLGTSRQQLAQQQMDAQRNLNLQRLGIMQSALGQQPANLGQSTTSPMYQNTGANILGGALLGSQLGGMKGMEWLGTGMGAGLGGLLGLLG